MKSPIFYKIMICVACATFIAAVHVGEIASAGLLAALIGFMIARLTSKKTNTEDQ